jgi:hypothetical protein
MKKSMWIEVVEWCVFGAVALFITGVFAMRSEIIADQPESLTAPIYSLDE